MGPAEDPLTFLLALNGELADRETNGVPITGPGLPPTAGKDASAFTSADRITVERSPH